MQFTTVSLLLTSIAALSSALPSPAAQEEQLPDCSRYRADKQFSQSSKPDIQTFTVDTKNPGWSIEFLYNNLIPELKAKNPNRNNPDEQFNIWSWYDNVVVFANLANGTKIHSCSTASDSTKNYGTECVQLLAGQFCQANQVVPGSPKHSFKLKVETTILAA